MMQQLNRFIFLSLAIAFASLYIASLEAAPNEKISRLFTSAVERNKMNLLRQNQALKVIRPLNDLASKTSLNTNTSRPSELIIFQGYVKRSDRIENTLWINKQAVQEGGLVANVQIGQLNRREFLAKSANSLSLSLKSPVNGKLVRLKVGQIYNPETGEIRALPALEKAEKLHLEKAED
jgi:hypothetical protein